MAVDGRQKCGRTCGALPRKSGVCPHGGAWGTEQELNIIKGGGIWYKKADIHEVSVNIIDKTAILLNRIDLLAEVGGNEVTNPFEVTEVYVKQDGSWKLGSLSFTRLMAVDRTYSRHNTNGAYGTKYWRRWD